MAPEAPIETICGSLRASERHDRQRARAQPQRHAAVHLDEHADALQLRGALVDLRLKLQHLSGHEQCDAIEDQVQQSRVQEGSGKEPVPFMVLDHQRSHQPAHGDERRQGDVHGGVAEPDFSDENEGH